MNPYVLPYRECADCKTTYVIEQFAVVRDKRGSYIKTTCRQCSRIRRRAVVDKRAEADRAWRAANADYIRVSQRKWRKANRDHVRSYAREYWAKTRDRRNSYKRRHYTENREEILSRRAQHRAEGRMINLSRLRKARVRGATGKCSKAALTAKLQYYGHRCRYCKTPLTSTNLSFDHAIPVSRGGTNWPANLLPCCLRCNMRKNAYTFFEFMRQIREGSVVL